MRNVVEEEFVYRPGGFNLKQILYQGGLFSEDNRPLLELNAERHVIERAAIARAQFKTVPSPYSGSRNRTIEGNPEQLINKSALEVMRSVFGEVKDGFSWLSERFYKESGNVPPEQMHLSDFLEVTTRAKHLAPFLHFRAHGYADSNVPVPVAIANIHKSAAGLAAVALNMTQ